MLKWEVIFERALGIATADFNFSLTQRLGKIATLGQPLGENRI